MYLHQLPKWPDFYFDFPKTYWALVDVRHNQGKLLGRMESLGFNLQKQAGLQNLTLDVIKSSEIEGEILNPEQVRSSIARRLGIDIGGFVPADRDVEGIVDMMVDATQHYKEPLTAERLFRWHTSLFPANKYKMTIGAWRTNAKDAPMQVVSGPIGYEKVHFQAPDSDKLDAEMQKFLDWFNDTDPMLDPVIKAAMAHLWFVTIHPFDDGNGRIGRAIADMAMARADETPYRFYSMSAQIRAERNTYYHMLQETQRSKLDITEWLAWFLQCFDRSIAATDNTLATIMKRKKFWDNFATEPLNERQKKMLSKLLDDFEGKLTSSKWAKINKCSQDTATRDIQDLITKGILEKEDSGGRNTNYALKEIA